MEKRQNSAAGEPKLGKTLREDLHQKDFGRTVRRDFRELKEFFLDDNRKKKLEEMRRVRRWLYTIAWLMRSLFLKLTPVRRLLLVVAFVLAILSNDVRYNGDHIRIQFDFGPVAGAIVLFVLMLELKDKLLARDELEAGRAVQLALAPEQTPEIPGWSAWLFTRTANEVGGDLVDIQKLAAEKYRIALADVAGKGLSAALLTAKLQATLRAIAPDIESISEVGSKLNRIFCRDSLRNVFASVVYIEVHPDTGTVRLINAGHLPPVRVSGNHFEEVPKGNAAIGILPESTYDEQRTELEKGEFLLVYSDGLSDAKNESGEFFGTQRLLALLPKLNDLSAAGVGERIIYEVDRFIGDARVYDDLSMVVLKRTA